MNDDYFVDQNGNFGGSEEDWVDYRLYREAQEAADLERSGLWFQEDVEALADAANLDSEAA